MKFNNKRDSPDCTLTKIILISYLLSNVIMFFVMYNPWAYKRVYCHTETETETTIETEPVITTYVVENIDYIHGRFLRVPGRGKPSCYFDYRSECLYAGSS